MLFCSCVVHVLQLHFCLIQSLHVPVGVWCNAASFMHAGNDYNLTGFNQMEQIEWAIHCKFAIFMKRVNGRKPNLSTPVVWLWIGSEVVIFYRTCGVEFNLSIKTTLEGRKSGPHGQVISCYRYFNCQVKPLLKVTCFTSQPGVSDHLSCWLG